jgi:CxxC-x17-CxxC domain-containing protein
MQYRDRTLTCVECNNQFVFTAGEQLFYAEKGFRNDPKHCKNCKSRRSETFVPSGRTHARNVTVTTCSQCGKETTVPFKLTQGRPVYCLQCFQQRRAAGIESRPHEGRRPGLT